MHPAPPSLLFHPPTQAPEPILHAISFKAPAPAPYFNDGGNVVLHNPFVNSIPVGYFNRYPGVGVGPEVEPKYGLLIKDPAAITLIDKFPKLEGLMKFAEDYMLRFRGKNGIQLCKENQKSYVEAYENIRQLRNNKDGVAKKYEVCVTKHFALVAASKNVEETKIQNTVDQARELMTSDMERAMLGVVPGEEKMGVWWTLNDIKDWKSSGLNLRAMTKIGDIFRLDIADPEYNFGQEINRSTKENLLKIFVKLVGSDLPSKESTAMLLALYSRKDSDSGVSLCSMRATAMLKDINKKLDITPDSYLNLSLKKFLDSTVQGGSHLVTGLNGVLQLETSRAVRPTSIWGGLFNLFQ
ncbi:hypothetical protein BY996DRAFT_6414442 [Phakopsora pachyrhizi]|nr:hypothetical protein BY996DRAFT_6414442 [Phakopsora pachyrhizi]